MTSNIATNYADDLVQLFESDTRTAADIILQNVARMKEMAEGVAILRQADSQRASIVHAYNEIAQDFAQAVYAAADKLAKDFHGGKPDLPAFQSDVAAAHKAFDDSRAKLKDRAEGVADAVKKDLAERAAKRETMDLGTDKPGGKKRNGKAKVPEPYPIGAIVYVRNDAGEVTDEGKILDRAVYLDRPPTYHVEAAHGTISGCPHKNLEPRDGANAP